MQAQYGAVSSSFEKFCSTPGEFDHHFLPQGMELDRKNCPGGRDSLAKKNFPGGFQYFGRGDKFMGYTGTMQMGYGERTFLYKGTMGQAHFLENIYRANTFFHSFYELFFTLDTICADIEDKPMAGCKNQLIKSVRECFSS